MDNHDPEELQVQAPRWRHRVQPRTGVPLRIRDQHGAVYVLSDWDSPITNDRGSILELIKQAFPAESPIVNRDWCAYFDSSADGCWASPYNGSLMWHKSALTVQEVITEIDRFNIDLTKTYLPIALATESDPAEEEAYLLIALNRTPASTRRGRGIEWFNHLKGVKDAINEQLLLLHGFSNTARDAPQMILHPSSTELRPIWTVTNGFLTFSADADTKGPVNESVEALRDLLSGEGAYEIGMILPPADWWPASPQANSQTDMGFRQPPPEFHEGPPAKKVRSLPPPSPTPKISGPDEVVAAFVG